MSGGSATLDAAQKRLSLEQQHRPSSDGTSTVESKYGQAGHVVGEERKTMIPTMFLQFLRCSGVCLLLFCHRQTKEKLKKFMDSMLQKSGKLRSLVKELKTKCADDDGGATE